MAGETLIFFDEIQDCKEALNTLKYFKEDAPEYYVIAAGSLLGVATKHKRKEKDEEIQDDATNTFPVGKVSFLDMYPVTSREYLRMANQRLMEQMEANNRLKEISCRGMYKDRWRDCQNHVPIQT